MTVTVSALANAGPHHGRLAMTPGLEANMVKVIP